MLSGTRRAPFPVPGEERPRKTAQRNEVEVKAEQQASLQRADGRERHRPGDRPRDERCDDDRESLHALETLVTEAGGIVAGRMAPLAEGDAAERSDIIYLAKLPLFNADGSIKA